MKCGKGARRAAAAPAAGNDTAFGAMPAGTKQPAGGTQPRAYICRSQAVAVAMSSNVATTGLPTVNCRVRSVDKRL